MREKTRLIITSILTMGIVFCFWGMFDCVNWAVLYGAQSFPFPFFLFDTNVYKSADILITVGCVCTILLIIVASKWDIKLKQFVRE